MPDAIVVLPDEEFAHLVPGRDDRASAARARRPRRSSAARSHADAEVALPGRLERRGGEIRDGAHNPDGVALAGRAAPRRRLHASCASILADKDVDDDAAQPSRARAARFVATALPQPARAAGRASSPSSRARTSSTSRSSHDPVAALARAHELGRPCSSPARSICSPTSRTEEQACGMARDGERLRVFAFAALVVAAIVGLAFALGYLVGKLLL